MAFCPRCEHLTAEPDPTGKAEMYCSRAGCGWDGTKAQAMTPLARAEARADHFEALNKEAHLQWCAEVKLLRTALENIRREVLPPVVRASLLHRIRAQVDAALAPRVVADAEKRKLVDTMRHKDGSHCGDKNKCRRAHLYAPRA